VEHGIPQPVPDSTISLTMEEIYFTVAEVARRLGVSTRWLADECRAGRVEHIHIARRRRFTAAQVDVLVSRHTVQTEQVVAPRSTQRLEQTRERVARRLSGR
jgi:excisionase family DNA binding protein